MKERLYTDLALEERERYEENVEISGVQIEEEYNQKLQLTTTVVTIVNRNGEKKMGKPRGRYVTMESRLFREEEQKMRMGFVERIKKHLVFMTEKYRIKKILIVGLGNAEATPDALGPQVVGKIKIREGIYCIAPGVLAQTGMESCEIVKGIVEEIQPDLILVIDSLASRNLRRVSTTIQLTDTGIVPGSGVGNHRKGLNEHTLKKKVFALGVPMVVSGATIVNDTMEKLLQILTATNANGTLTGILENYSAEEKYQLFEELLSEETEQTFVTPKDVDEIVENLSDILSEAINLFCKEQVICQD